MRASRRGISLVWVSCAVAIVGAACRDGAPTRAPTREPGTWTLRAERGDDESGEAGEEAVEPLVVSLRDESGHAVAGVAVTWSAAGGGAIRVEQPRTDSSGRQIAWWTFGSRDEPQLATADMAAGQRVSFRGRIRRAPELPTGVLTPLSFDTFDGSGQVVHPDVVGLPFAWDGGRAQLAMAITPYPYGDEVDEDPSLYVGATGREWTPPQGVRNPLARSLYGYLSDPDVLYNPVDHRLWLYYREVVQGENVIRLITSADGVQWDEPREVVRVPNHGLISPSVVRRDATTWLMWSVNGGTSGCKGRSAFIELRRSSDGLHWSAPEPVHLDQPALFPWHVDVQWIRRRREYWALYNVKPAGACVTPALYLATSPDGVDWTTYPTPVLQRAALPAFDDVVYRSSFLYNVADDAVTFYYSGARYDGQRYVWGAAVQRRDRQALFADLARPPMAPLMRARIGLPDPERPDARRTGSPFP